MFQDLETAIISMFGVGWQPGGVGHVDGEIAGYGSVEDIESSVQYSEAVVGTERVGCALTVPSHAHGSCVDAIECVAGTKARIDEA